MGRSNGIDRLHSLVQKGLEDIQPPYWQGYTAKQCQVSANAIAHQLLVNRRYEGADKETTKTENDEICDLWAASGADRHLSTGFSEDEMVAEVIEAGFETKQKVKVVPVDLTAVYDKVWHRVITLKMLRMIPNQNLVRFIVEMISNRSFMLKTSSRESSRLQSQERCSPRYVPVPNAVQHLYQRSPVHNCQTVWLCQQTGLAKLGTQMRFG